MDYYLTALSASRHLDDRRRAHARTLGRDPDLTPRRRAAHHRLRVTVGRVLVTVGARLQGPAAAVSPVTVTRAPACHLTP